jgi:hypothetical protein
MDQSERGKKVDRNSTTVQQARRSYFKKPAQENLSRQAYPEQSNQIRNPNIEIRNKVKTNKSQTRKIENAEAESRMF